MNVNNACLIYVHNLGIPSDCPIFDVKLGITVRSSKTFFYLL
jgi:hypothetical protein